MAHICGAGFCFVLKTIIIKSEGEKIYFLFSLFPAKP